MGYQAEPVHGHEHTINSCKSEPEVQLAEGFVEMAREYFWKPEKKSAKDCECGGNAHHEMKVAGDEFVADGSSGEIVAHEKKPGNSASQEKRNESEGEKHRRIELDLGVPESAEPTTQEDAGGQTKRGGQQ